MKSILVISLSNIKSDPRVTRQLHCLAARYELVVAGYGQRLGDARIRHVSLENSRPTFLTKVKKAIMLRMGFHELVYWTHPAIQSALAKLSGSRFDLVLANDIDTLPLALRLAGSAPVLLDAHEYSPREFEENLAWRMIMQPYKDYLCRTHMPRAAGMLTVCQGIADEYERVYGVRPKVVMNAPAAQDLSPAKLTDGKIRLIHHGAALKGRRLESMIDMAAHLDKRFTLDFMLVPSDADYLESLKRYAGSEPRIRFLEPVALAEICPALNKYDMGIYILEPSNFNNAHALPNKFFEFVQARLGVAIGPSPEMAALVKHYNLGVVADSFEPKALADKLNSLTSDDIYGFKENAHLATRDLSFGHSGEVLLGEVRRLLRE